MDLSMKPGRLAPALSLVGALSAAAFAVSDSPWVLANPSAFLVSFFWFLFGVAFAVAALDSVVARETIEASSVLIDNEAGLAEERAEKLAHDLASGQVATELAPNWYNRMLGHQSLSLDLRESASRLRNYNVTEPGPYLIASNLCITIGIMNSAWVLTFGPIVEFSLKFPPIGQ